MATAAFIISTVNLAVTLWLAFILIRRSEWFREFMELLEATREQEEITATIMQEWDRRGDDYDCD